MNGFITKTNNECTDIQDDLVNIIKETTIAQIEHMGVAYCLHVPKICSDAQV